MKIKIAIILSLFFTFQFSTNIFGHNPSKYETLLNPPEIVITKPITLRGFMAMEKTFETSKELVTIEGYVNSNAGIKEFMINNVEAELLHDGKFSTMLQLKPGQNKVVIIALDNNSEKTTAKLTINFTENVSEVFNNNGKASASWIKPANNNSETADKEYNLKACIKSTSKIEEIKILVNNKTRILNSFKKPDFRADCDMMLDETVTLCEGENHIIVEIKNKASVSKLETDIIYKTFAGKYYALFIGVENYTHINELSNPISDAQNLMDVLVANYSFEKDNITFIKNPTRSDVIDELDVVAKKIQKDDNLLIFYAGHGYFDTALNVGFWLPKDAQRDKRSNWISNSNLKDYIAGINSKHTLLISDACFSGAIFKTRALSSATEAINRLYDMPSRKAMTSGTMTEVPDESVFIKYLVKRLEENKEDYLPASKLFFSFKEAVQNNSKNIPQYGTIQGANDEGGDFIFIKKR